MKLIYFSLIILLSSCASQKKQTTLNLMDSISIGDLTNLSFDGHVGLPKYETNNLTVYNCRAEPKKISLTAQSDDLEYVDFFCLNYQKYIPYIESLFDNKISFLSQKKYAKIKILWGDAIYQTSPDTYIIRKINPINDTVIFHELGHRLSFLLVENIKIPLDVAGFVTIGIIDYFAASIANEPVLAKDFVPNVFIRNIGITKKYPKDLSYFKELSEKFNSAYSKEFKSKAYHERFYKMFLKMSKQNKDLVEGHTSGMIISSLLWALREKFGHQKMDRVIANAIMQLKDLPQFREKFLKNLSKQEINEKTIQWYDFLTSVLIVLKKDDLSLETCKVALEKFKDVGFDLNAKYQVGCK